MKGMRAATAFLLVLAAAGPAAGDDNPAPVLSVARTIQLRGDVPRDLALSRDGATLLVATSSANADGGRLKVLAVPAGRQLGKDIKVGGVPSAVALSPTGKYAYVAGTGNGSGLTRVHLGKMDTAGESTVAPSAGALLFSEDGKFAYVGGESLPRMDIVDVQWNQVDGAVSGLPKGLRRAVMVPGGRFIYATVAGGKVVKMDLVGGVVAKTIPVEGTDIAVAADGSRVFVGAGAWDAEIKVISTSTDEVLKTIDTGLVPGALAADPQGRWLWAALPRNGKVAVVDVEAGKIAATIATGKRPAVLAVAPDGKTLYCANAGEAGITVVEATIPGPAEAPAPVPETPASKAAAVAEPSATALAIAVTDFESQGVAGSVASIVTEWLRDEVLKAGAYRMLERRRMDALLAEQTLQQTGCTDQECAVKLGKLLNVRRMVVGSLGKFEESYVVIVRMVEVEDGQVVWSGTAKGKSGDDVEAAVRRLARELSASGK